MSEIGTGVYYVPFAATDSTRRSDGKPVAVAADIRRTGCRVILAFRHRKLGVSLRVMLRVGSFQNSLLRRQQNLAIASRDLANTPEGRNDCRYASH